MDCYDIATTNSRNSYDGFQDGLRPSMIAIMQLQDTHRSPDAFSELRWFERGPLPSFGVPDRHQPKSSFSRALARDIKRLIIYTDSFV